MSNLNLVIKSIVLMQPTANMIAAKMTSPRWVVGVIGNYPRTDKAGQSSISIPEATMAIALQNNAMIDSMDLEDAKQYLATNRTWRQNLIGGRIGGIDFQKKGDKYQLTARSNDVKEGNANVGDTREVKNNMFIVDYDSLTLMANIDMLKIDRIAEQTVAASRAISGSYASMFAPVVTPESGNDEPSNDEPSNDEPSNDEPSNDEPSNDGGGINPWGDTLESMVAFAEENGLTEELTGKQLTKAGNLMKGKSLDSLSATIEVIAAD